MTNPMSGDKRFDRAKDPMSPLRDEEGDPMAGGDDQADDLFDQTGDYVDDYTDGRFSDQIDTGQETARDRFDRVRDDQHDEYEQ